MNDDELLRRYLLGELPEAEVERLEPRLLADDALFELAEAVEADLLAACARGELAPEERERVLLRLASSPQGRERLALAQGLTALAEPRSTVVPFPVRTPPLARPAVRWAAVAAGLLAVAGGSWFALHQTRTPEGSSKIVEEIPPPPTNPRENPVLPPPPETPSVIVREEPPPVITPERHETAEPEIRTQFFTLALGVLRDAGDLQKFEIEPGVQQVEIGVDLTEMEGFESFRALLRNKDTGTTWEKSELEPRQMDWGPALVLDLPADALPNGIYELKIQGVGAGGQTEDAVQEFEIVHVS
jgi:hypothetical protein